MNVFAYLRTGSLKQSEDEVSIEVQEQQVEAYANLQSLSVNHWRRDRGVSGAVPLGSRLSGRMLLEQVQPGDVVIAAKLDRMFRNAHDALKTIDDLRKRGVSLHFVDLGGDVCNGIGKLVSIVLSAVAEQSRPKFKEQIAAAKQKMRSEDRYQGGKIPFGYRVDSEGKLLEDELQQRCLKFMKAQRDEGRSYREISKEMMNELGVRLSHSGIQRILKGIRKTS
jgi:DNA invertase Pin-like site-specific DNA recombinase